MTVEYRYPNAQIENETDFLEIKVVKYEPPGFNSEKFQQGTPEVAFIVGNTRWLC